MWARRINYSLLLAGNLAWRWFWTGSGSWGPFYNSQFELCIWKAILFKPLSRLRRTGRMTCRMSNYSFRHRPWSAFGGFATIWHLRLCSAWCLNHSAQTNDYTVFSENYLRISLLLIYRKAFWRSTLDHSLSSLSGYSYSVNYKSLAATRLLAVPSVAF